MKLKFTSNKEWTEEEIEQNCKTIATGYIIVPDLELLEKEWEKELDKKVKEIKDHFKIKE